MPPVERFLRACLRLPVDRTPVWIMRQAGRYLPEYRDVRRRASFLDLCHDPDLACEVTLQPLRRFDLDAAILFSDIMVPVEAMGVGIEFKPGPVIAAPIRTAADVARLRTPDPADDLRFVGAAIRQVRAALADLATGRGAPHPVPLIGFAGAPFTLACYLVDGAGSKTFPATRALMQGQSAVFSDLMARLVDTVALFLQAQIEAGAQAVQIFDSWVGLLGPSDFREFVVPHLERLMERVRGRGVPVIYFAFGGATLLPLVRELRPDVAGIDWRTPLDDARKALGPDIAVQGNLDPAVLLGPHARIRRDVERVLGEAGPGPGHVFNLGHGIWKETPVEAVEALVRAVRDGSPAAGPGTGELADRGPRG